MFLPYHFEHTCDKSIEVYQQSKEYIKTSGHEERISDLAWTYHSVGNLIPQTTESWWSGHTFPWLESWEELEISFNLCQFGLYKQAMMSLRGGLELGLLSVYWNLNDDGHEAIQEWGRSQKNTPRSEPIWKKLRNHKNFQSFPGTQDIEVRVNRLGFLHNYVHTKGIRYSNSFGLLQSICQTFEAKAFRIWFRTFEEILKVLSILHLVKYPIGVIKYDYSTKFGIDTSMFGGLKPFQVERLERLIGEDVFRQIEIVAEVDEHVKTIKEWISKLPDISEDEIENQIREFDKSMIVQKGLERWLEMEIRDKDSFPEIRDSEWYQRRIEFLINWAKENGYEKSA